MFSSNKQPQADIKDTEQKKRINDLEKELTDTKHEHSLETAKLQAEHSIALKEKEFELKHFKDEDLAKARTDLTAKEQENAVLKKENEMLVKITDLNADVIDVKDLVSSLIKKLPEVNITGLTVTAPEKK